MKNKPKIEDVIAFFVKSGLPEAMAKKWFYEKDAVGWMIGKNKIINWESAAALFILQTLETAPDKVQIQSKFDVFEADPFLAKGLKKSEAVR